MCVRQPLHVGDRAARDAAFHDGRRAFLSPEPASHPNPVVQVFAARTWGIRGVFVEHTRIAVKPQGASAYTVYQIKGWLLCGHGIVPPRLLFDQRGPAAGTQEGLECSLQGLAFRFDLRGRSVELSGLGRLGNTRLTGAHHMSGPVQ
jgi:hypothetical protein